jgi:hypothetical protein
MEVGHDRREKVDTRPEGVEEALRVVVRATMKGIDTALSIEAYINDMRYVCEGSLYQVNKYSNGPSLLPSKAEHPVAWSSPRTTHQSRGRAGETWPCATCAVIHRAPHHCLLPILWNTLNMDTVAGSLTASTHRFSQL